jgi:hypothetical protein
VYGIVDVLPGAGSVKATWLSRSKLDWFLYQAGMLTFRPLSPTEGNLDLELLVGRRQKCRS